MDASPDTLNNRHVPIVLVVDDIPENLGTIVEFVRELNVEVRAATNGDVALRYARLPPRPDLILLDVMMPGKDGHQVLRELRANPETKDIPVIFVTALDSLEDEKTGLSEGAVDYITKPINPDILKARVRTHLDLQATRQELERRNVLLGDEVGRTSREKDRLESNLAMTLAATGMCVWEYERETGRLYCGCADQSCTDDSWRPIDVDGTLTKFLACVHPQDRLGVEEGLRSEQRTLSFDFRVQQPNGQWCWYEMHCHNRPAGEIGGEIQTTGLLFSIDYRKKTEARQRLSSAVLAGISEGVCITDADASILYINHAFSNLTGYAESEVIGRNPRLLKSGVHGAEFYRHFWEAILADGNWQGEITNRRKDGALITEWLSISAVRGKTGQIENFVAVFSDLSERKESAQRIQYLSSFDPLTDLPNRTLFTDRLDQSLSAAKHLGRQTAVILLDLDHFRSINDTLGPPVGDSVLIEIGRRLTNQIREGDTLGRRSGNEFGLVMANLAHEDDVFMLAQRLLEAVAAPFDIDGREFAITSSIGISVSPRDGAIPEELLAAADLALSRAKESGRNTYRFFSPEMDADAARRMSIENALRGALVRNEFSVVYQPQISLETGKLIGMEALVRWRNEQFGAVSPSEFIPIAESSGTILDIGHWVLRVACEDARRWIDLGFPDLRVSVNLSTRQFRQSNLPDRVAAVLADSRLPSSALELEITESAFIDNVDNAVAQARALKGLGIKLSLDDFGTGYSSLAYLSRFPFDKLKIDQGFVRDITSNPVNAAIATAAIVMARSLNLEVLAEGVETDAQARFLRGKRCDSMQGYLFSRPLTPEDFQRLLTDRVEMSFSEHGTSEGEQTLLLLDDETSILASLNRLLRREGYRILTASTPAEAFDLLAKHKVQVIVSDQRMPEMTGSEFFARVRHLYPDSLRIILTGYTDIDSVSDAVNRGAIYKFLTKPWDDDSLRDLIKEAFRLARDIQSQSVDTSAAAE